MTLLICGAKSISKIVIITAMMPNIIMEFPTVLPLSSFFPQPICCPKYTVVPMAKLLIKFVRVIIIWEPVDTAETSADVANFPTIKRSTAPYIACKNRANRTGSANKISGPTIFPSVKVVFFSIASFLFPNKIKTCFALECGKIFPAI